MKDGRNVQEEGGWKGRIARREGKEKQEVCIEDWGKLKREGMGEGGVG